MESLERKLQQQLAEMAAKFEQKLLEQNSTLEQKMEASETRLIQALPSETNLVAPMNERLDQQTNQMTQQMTHQMTQQNMMMVKAWKTSCTNSRNSSAFNQQHPAMDDTQVHRHS